MGSPVAVVVYLLALLVLDWGMAARVWALEKRVAKLEALQKEDV